MQQVSDPPRSHGAVPAGKSVWSSLDFYRPPASTVRSGGGVDAAHEDRASRHRHIAPPGKLLPPRGSERLRTHPTVDRDQLVARHQHRLSRAAEVEVLAALVLGTLEAECQRAGLRIAQGAANRTAVIHKGGAGTGLRSSSARSHPRGGQSDPVMNLGTTPPRGRGGGRPL